MATEVPPIVIDITASDKSFIATFAKDKALLTDWAKASARAKLGADSTGFQDHIATAKTELLDFAKNVSRAKLGADAAPFWTEIAALRTTLDTMSPLDVRVDANTGLAMAKIAALRGDLASASIGSLLAGAAGGAAGGGGGGWGSVLAGMLGFGGRRRGAIPGLGALAGVGTLGGFAGLGSEHVIGTLGGLAGFAGAGALGGGLLGAGTLGVAGVGMGTDLAGIGQAAGDIKLTVQAQNALNQAIAVYGKNSIQAQQAQAQLNYTLSGFPKVAQGAIHAAANTAQGFHAMFNRLTGPAEKIGAQIIQQAMKVGEAFLPTIGASAAQNMGIIKKDLQPLFAWFQNPGAQGGLGIFKNLEKIFTGQLPMAIKTLTQGVELFARTINVAAGYTGKFMPKLEAFLARANSPTGFAKWSKDIGKLIGDFRIWEHFMMAVARAFTGLLGPAQGTGKGIVVVLTGMIDKFDKWERSAKGMASLTSLLSAHKAELINILKLLPPLVAAFGKIELTAGPALTTVVSLLAKFVGLVLKIPGVGTILAFGVAFAVIASKMKLLGAFGAFFTGAGKDASVLERAFASLGSGAAALLTKITTLVVGEDAMNAATGAARAAMVALTTVGILVVAAGVYELIKHFGVLHGLMIAGAVAVVGLTVAFWALDAVPVVALVVGIALAIAGLVAGIIELVKHWDTVWKTIKDVTSTAITFVKNHLSLFAMGLGAIFLGPLGLLVGYFLTHWDTIKKDATAAWNAITSFVKGVPGKILGTLSSLGSDIANVAKAAWHLFQNGVSTGTTDVINFVKGIPKKILAALGDVGSLLLDAGKMIITGLENGIKNAAKGAVDAVKNVGKDIISGVKSALHIFSPSQDMVEAGQYVIQGLQNGISDTGTSAAIMTTIQNLAGKMLTYLKTQVPLWHAIGVSFMQGLSAGIASASAQVAAAAVKAANDAVTATKTATKTSSPSQVFAEQGGYWMLGIVQGITANKGRVQSALTSSIPTMGKSNSGYVGAVAGGGIVINSNPIININGATGNPANVGDAVRKAIEQANDHLVMSIRAGAGMAN